MTKIRRLRPAKLAGCNAGEGTADSPHEEFLRLYETQFDQVARFISWYTGSCHGEELAVKVFIQAIHSPDAGADGPSSKVVWLFQKALLICGDWLAGHGQRIVLPPPRHVAANSGDSIGGDGAGRFEEDSGIFREIGNLNQEERLSLALRFGGGLTSEQIAEVIDEKIEFMLKKQSAALSKLAQGAIPPLPST